jgi:hypothetical protein
VYCDPVKADVGRVVFRVLKIFVNESESVWAWTLEATKRKPSRSEDALEGAMVDVKNMLIDGEEEVKPDRGCHGRCC